MAVGLAAALALASVGMASAAPVSATPTPPTLASDVTITITVPANGVHLDQGNAVAAQYSCVPTTGPGTVDYCKGSVPNGAAVDTTTVGQHIFQVETRYLGVVQIKAIAYVVDPFRGQLSIASPLDDATYDRATPPLGIFACDFGQIGQRACYATDTWNQPGRPVVTPVPVSGQRLPSQVGKHTFTVTGVNGSGVESTYSRTYSITVGHVPDLAIAGKGTDIHGDVGAQTVSYQRKRTVQTVKLTIQNDGRFVERFRVRGDGTQLRRVTSGGSSVLVPGWQVRYFEPGSCATCLGRDITKWVVGGTYLTAPLTFRGTQTILMAVAATPVATPIDRDVTVSSRVDPLSQDTVRASLR